MKLTNWLESSSNKTFISLTLFYFLLFITLALFSNYNVTILFVIFFLLPIMTLPVYMEKKYPNNKSFTNKTLLFSLVENALRISSEIANFMTIFLPDMVIKSLSLLFTVAFMGVVTLRLFLIPDGLIGMIAKYLVQYSRSTGQDFITVYAVFSTAVVISILLVISLSQIFIDGLSYDVEKLAVEPEE